MTKNKKYVYSKKILAFSSFNDFIFLSPFFFPKLPGASGF